jgi:hypothetical protein
MVVTKGKQLEDDPVVVQLLTGKPRLPSLPFSQINSQLSSLSSTPAGSISRLNVGRETLTYDNTVF